MCDRCLPDPCLCECKPTPVADFRTSRMEEIEVTKVYCSTCKHALKAARR